MTTAGIHHDVSLDRAAELAAQLRVDSIRCSTSAGSGHPTSGMSAADLLAVLVSRHLRYDWDDARSPFNDHLIFSKGHASPLLYSVFRRSDEPDRSPGVSGRPGADAASPCRLATGLWLRAHPGRCGSGAEAG
jgi:Transketolase, thiamine diphosphate binding domain